MTTKLHELPDRWREHAEGMREEHDSEGFAVAREMCADELAAALAETP